MHPGCDVGLEVAFLKVAFSSKVAEADAFYQRMPKHLPIFVLRRLG